MGEIKRYYKVQIDHIVNAEAGVVVAIARGCSDIVVDDIEKRIQYGNLWYDEAQRYKINDTYRAVARLYPGDTFDEQLGKDIATKRLHHKLDKVVSRKLKKFAQSAEEMANKAHELAGNYQGLVSKFDSEPLF